MAPRSGRDGHRRQRPRRDGPTRRQHAGEVRHVPAKLIIQLLGEATSAISAFKKTADASKTATDASKKTGSALGGIAKAVAAGYAVKKVVDFGKASVDAAGEAAKANKLLNAVFKNVGDSSGEAAKHAIDLAESLGRQIGVTPDVIKGAEGILATFHSVSGAAGMQAGIFDRATKAAADLAVAGYGNMSSNAVQLGKALEDPTKGLAALTKSGVNFTAAQKDQIKNMQKSGDMLGAQKIILGEVENQVKGTAAATAGSGAKMSVAYKEMQASLGTAFLPAISKVKGQLAGLFDFVTANSSWLVPLVGGAVALAGGMVAVSKAVSIFKTALEGTKLAVAGVKAAWVLLNGTFLASPLGLIIIGIVALVAALVILYLKVDWFRKGVDSALRGVVVAFQATWTALVAAFNWLTAFLQRWGNLILLVIMGPWYIVFKLIRAAITGGWSGVMAQINSWLGIIARAVAGSPA